MSKVTDRTHPLRLARESASLTREQLSMLAQVSTSTITRIELQQHSPSLAAMQRLAGALGVPLSSIVS